MALALIQQAQQHPTEPHPADAVIQLLDPDDLMRQRLAHPAAGLLPADLAILVGLSQVQSGWVLHLSQILGETPQ